MLHLDPIARQIRRQTERPLILTSGYPFNRATDAEYQLAVGEKNQAFQLARYLCLHVVGLDRARFAQQCGIRESVLMQEV